MTDDIRRHVRQQVQQLLQQQGDQAAFGDNDSLVQSARLSSLQIVELASQLERVYGLNFAAIGFDQYQFDTINAIVDLVTRNRKS